MGNKMGMNNDLENEFADALADELEKEINREIIQSIVLTKEGWVSVSYADALSYKRFMEIAKWLDDNIKGPTKMSGGCWWFKDPQDKVLFLLRWSEWL